MNRHSSQSAPLRTLRGLRLGKCARRILLLAPLPSEEASVVLPERAGRAAAESHRRAMRSLAENGLIELTWKTALLQTKQERQGPSVIWDPDAGVYQSVRPQHARVERSVERRAVRLTRLGEILVDRLRPTLENGRRIRWNLVVGSERD